MGDVINFQQPSTTVPPANITSLAMDLTTRWQLLDLMGDLAQMRDSRDAKGSDAAVEKMGLILSRHEPKG
jgi:hypothetical protein